MKRETVLKHTLISDQTSLFLKRNESLLQRGSQSGCSVKSLHRIKACRALHTSAPQDSCFLLNVLPCDRRVFVVSPSLPQQLGPLLSAVAAAAAPLLLLLWLLLLLLLSVLLIRRVRFQQCKELSWCVRAGCYWCYYQCDLESHDYLSSLYSLLQTTGLNPILLRIVSGVRSRWALTRSLSLTYQTGCLWTFETAFPVRQRPSEANSLPSLRSALRFMVFVGGPWTPFSFLRLSSPRSHPRPRTSFKLHQV